MSATSAMGTGPTVALVIGGVVLFVAIFGIVQLMFSRASKRKEAEARLEFPGARRVEAGALFFGQQSRGAAQLRGNGTLVLTGPELVFKQWIVNREFRVACSSIDAVETPRWFLGKSQGAKLLCVRYRTDSGGEDALAWRVRDLDGWIGAMEQARGTQ